MIIKASTALRNDFSTIDNLAEQTAEPIYITKNGEGSGVYMNINAFEKREQILKLRERLLRGEEERLRGEGMMNTKDTKELLEDILNEL